MWKCLGDLVNISLSTLVIATLTSVSCDKLISHVYELRRFSVNLLLYIRETTYEVNIGLIAFRIFLENPTFCGLYTLLYLMTELYIFWKSSKQLLIYLSLRQSLKSLKRLKMWSGVLLFFLNLAWVYNTMVFFQCCFRGVYINRIIRNSSTG